jgi:putative ABC transport system substrate-binding protein
MLLSRHTRRREFITVLGGAAAWPLAVRAQQAERVRRIGWLDRYDESTRSRAVRTALLGGLANLGWVEGQNLAILRFFGATDTDQLRVFAAKLVSLAPDVIVAGGASPVSALQQTTQTIPIVFAGGGDAAAIGLVKNIARPEGNVTGFSSSEPTIGGKWLELLKQIAPNVARVAVVFNPGLAPTAPKYIAAIETSARSLSVQTVQVHFRETNELVGAIGAFASEPNGGLLILPPFAAAWAMIVKLAAEHRLPAIYPGPALAAEGGLIAYNSDLADQHRRAASYVDRLLHGAKIADLPVQFPTKFQLVINLRTAKALGLDVPPTLLARADEVIE